MPTNKPRIFVTFEPSDYETLERIAKKEKMSMSALVRKVIKDWIVKSHLKENSNGNRV